MGMEKSVYCDWGSMYDWTTPKIGVIRYESGKGYHPKNIRNGRNYIKHSNKHYSIYNMEVNEN